MKPSPYCSDFPSLIRVPAASYFDTLKLSGEEHDAALAHLLVMDVLVKIAVQQAGAGLAFRAPENIFTEDVADKLGYQPGDQMNPEERAVINKATLVLRGDMEPSPIWGITEAA